MSEVAFSRLLAVAFLNVFMVLVQTPPTIGCDITTGDKIAEKGIVKKYFLKFALIITINSLLSAYHLSENFSYELSNLEIISLASVAIGFLLRMWCYYILGKHFTFVVAIKENHKLITSGPYRYLVHPSYLGQLMVIYGTLFFYGSYALMFVVMLGVYNFISLPKRMKVEEDFMRQHFGKEYDDYVASRWSLIPFVKN